MFGPEGGEPALAAGTARDGIHELQCLKLAPVCRVARHLARVMVTRGRLGPDERDVPTGGGGEVDRLGDRLDADVERAEEAPRRRQVGRSLHRWGRLGGVQRVDQDPVGARSTADCGQVGQVLDVADAPRAGRAHGVELGHQAPGPIFAGPSGQRVGSREPVGHDDEGGLGLPPVALGTDDMPAQRQGLRQPERRLTHRHPVDLPRRCVVLTLHDRPFGAGLVDDPHADVVAVVDVHGDSSGGAFAHDDGGRQELTPRLSRAVGQGAFAGCFGAGVDAKRREDLGEGHRRDRVQVAVEAPEVDADAVCLGQGLQLVECRRQGGCRGRGGRGVDCPGGRGRLLNGDGGVGHRSCLGWNGDRRRRFFHSCRYAASSPLPGAWVGRPVGPLVRRRRGGRVRPAGRTVRRSRSSHRRRTGRSR